MAKYAAHAIGIGIMQAVAAGQSATVAKGVLTSTELLSLGPAWTYVVSAVLRDPRVGQINWNRSVAGCRGRLARLKLAMWQKKTPNH